MLMIIDPQIDFISGEMAVEGAKEKMDALIRYIEKMDGKYACKAVTLDWHPFNHCSFEENGGQWPMRTAYCRFMYLPSYGRAAVQDGRRSQDIQERR